MLVRTPAPEAVLRTMLEHDTTLSGLEVRAQRWKMPSSLSPTRTPLLRNRRHYGYGHYRSVTAADLFQRSAL